MNLRRNWGIAEAVSKLGALERGDVRQHWGSETFDRVFRE